MINEISSAYPIIFTMFWQSSLFIAGGLMVSYLYKRHPARSHQVLFLSMIAAVAVPFMTITVKHLDLGMFMAGPETAVEYVTTEYIASSEVSVQPYDNPSMNFVPLVPVESEKPGLPWSKILFVSWVAASVILLARLMLKFVLGIQVVKNAQPFKYPKIAESIKAVTSKLGIKENMVVYSNKSVPSPAIWCWKRCPILLLPPDKRLLNDRIDLVGILCHELAHVKRRDHVSGLLSELMVVFLPWHPLLWWAKKRLLNLSEHACDDWVIAAGGCGVNYAESLLDLVPANQMAFVPAVVRDKNILKERIVRIVKGSYGNPRLSKKWILSAILITTCITLTVAFAQTRSAGPEEEPDMARAELATDAAVYTNSGKLSKQGLAETELYNNGKHAFDNGQYEVALKKFKAFLAQHPKTENADNAQFWIGEIYYHEKYFEKAIMEYQKVIENYPDSNKVPASLLKQGISFFDLGEEANARLILQEVINRYPTSDEAKISREKLGMPMAVHLQSAKGNKASKKIPVPNEGAPDNIEKLTGEVLKNVEPILSESQLPNFPERVAVLISKDIKPYMQAVDALSRNLKLAGEYQILQIVLAKSDENDLQNFWKALEQREYDLVVTVGEEASRFMTIDPREIAVPVVYTMLLNPENSMGQDIPACGVSLNIPIASQLGDIREKMPWVHTIGVLYDPANNSLFIQEAISRAKEIGLQVVGIPVDGKETIPSELEKNWDQMEALWLIPDKTVVSSEGMVPYLINEALLRKVPVIGYNRYFFDNGAALAFFLDRDRIGCQTAEIVTDRLEKNLCRNEAPEYEILVNERIFKQIAALSANY